MRKVLGPLGWPRGSEYRVSDAAGVGHPAGQRSGGVAVVVLVFAPVLVVFPATALKLREEASREGSFRQRRAPGQAAGGGPGRRQCNLGGLQGAREAVLCQVRALHKQPAAQQGVSTRHCRGMQAEAGKSAEELLGC